tara:strand:+ start:1029 stop:1808 length:780 start_codon:yes stop_codon:yes gene_type:complete
MGVRFLHDVLGDITGDITGDLEGTATNADDAQNAANITVADESSDTTCFPLFVTGATGNQAAKSGTNLTFNSESGLVTATGFAGALTGNVTGNVSGTAATVTTATQGDITSLGTLTALTVSGVLDLIGTTDSTDATGDTGILKCEGGASIAKKIYAGGTITGSVDVVAYSDEKLKENIKTLDGKKVLEMRGVSFDRIDTGKASSGVIAQEMEKVAPELVIDDGNYKGVAYGNLVGYLIEAVKDQQKQIDELKKICNGDS